MSTTSRLSRGSTLGASAIVVGVMVAVALLPPLVVAGLLAGAGYMQGAIGAVVIWGSPASGSRFPDRPVPP